MEGWALKRREVAAWAGLVMLLAGAVFIVSLIAGGIWSWTPWISLVVLGAALEVGKRMNPTPNE